MLSRLSHHLLSVPACWHAATRAVITGYELLPSLPPHVQPAATLSCQTRSVGPCLGFLGSGMASAVAGHHRALSSEDGPPSSPPPSDKQQQQQQGAAAPSSGTDLFTQAMQSKAERQLRQMLEQQSRLSSMPASSTQEVSIEDDDDEEVQVGLVFNVDFACATRLEKGVQHK